MSVPTFDYSLLNDVLRNDLADHFWANALDEPLERVSSAHQFASIVLLDKILSKNTDLVLPDADAKAYELFIRMNTRCATSFKGANPFRTVNGTDEFLGDMRSELYKFFMYGTDPYCLLNEVDILSNLDTGKGSALGADGTSFFEKMSSGSQYFSTYRLLALYRNYVTYSQSTWAVAQKEAYSQHGYGGIISHSRLLAVPKKAEISRTICVEPNGNVLFQKAIAKLLENRLRQVYGLDFSTQQDQNRSLAQYGSFFDNRATAETIGFGTLDLSSASDTISYDLMKYLLPEEVFRWLDAARTSHVETLSGSTAELSMLSSMGNAFTFPLMTLLFTVVVKVVYDMLGYKMTRADSDDPTWGVFGDDIIVLSQAYDLTYAALQLLGFIPNKDKSFNHGPFRESCGCDYYKGTQVRPVYLKSMKTIQDRFVAFNLLTMWGARHGKIGRAHV